MRAGLAFWAGVIGAAVMVFGMWIVRAAGGTDFNFGFWWGSMITGTATVASWWLGFVIHLIVGGLVGLIFAAAFEYIGRSNWVLGLLGGVGFAVVGGLFLEWISRAHPAIPQVIRYPGYFTATWGASSVIAFWVMSLIYGAIVGGMYDPIHKKGVARRAHVAEKQPVGAGRNRGTRDDIYVPPTPEERTVEDRETANIGRGRR
jgi:hypothetical protein